MKGGVTRPLLAVASEPSGARHQVVLKLRHPLSRDGHYGPTSLACELVCAVLARAVGLSVPDFAIIDLPAALLPAIPNQELRDVLGRNLGPNFGTVYQRGWSDFRPLQRLTAPPLLAQLSDVLSFDAAVINGDRKAPKPNLLQHGNDLKMIDHSLALPVHLWPDESIAESPSLPLNQVQEHCGYPHLRGRATGVGSYYPAWCGIIQPLELQQLRGLIPGEWDGVDVDKIFSFLAGRPSCLHRVAEDLAAGLA